MSEPGTPTVDQLRVFLAVVESGSLAGAGRKLGRATSAVSYAIENLEAVLGIEVFDRETTKKPRVSEAGKAVLAEAHALLRGFDKLRAKVKGLSDGLEAQVSLVVDVLFPADDLAAALRAFQTTFPTVPIRLYVEALGAVSQRLLEGDADLGVCGPLRIANNSLEYMPFRSITLLPVAAPDHPLASKDYRRVGSARDHVQLVLTDRSTLTEGQDFGVLADQTWRLGDLGAKHALLLAGVGWGNMPETMVREDLARGRLVALDLPEWKGRSFPFQIAYASASPPGPAGRWLLDRLIAGA